MSVSVPLLQIVRPCTHPLELPLIAPLFGGQGRLSLSRSPSLEHLYKIKNDP